MTVFQGSGKMSASIIGGSDVDVSKLMSVSTKAVGGKGGGKRILAWGGCPDPSRLDELLNKACEAFFHLQVLGLPSANQHL